ncbi:hypothetical protein [Phytobacter massiliensis]|uniref:hypothetical protein n=1 Tax=Phytobacter massiliensis TaxID=1485952 RepID=UPI0005C6ABAB|nr:hypothetical protein [Phytobacter massiliensis]
MLVLRFDLVFIQNEPLIAGLLIAFGPLVAMLFFGGVLHIPYIKWIAGVCAGSLALTWCPGFVMGVIMVLCNIDAVKILLCWIIIFIGVMSFVITNHRELAEIFRDYMTPEKLPLQKGKRRKSRQRVRK